jgi:transcriptional regulator with XRE-family HTH domain
MSLSFGGKLRVLRLRLEQSQIELANQLGLSSGAYISNLEAGRKLPSLDVVIRIADLFGVTTDMLLRDELSLPSQDKP